jgi:hypothetical protein
MIEERILNEYEGAVGQPVQRRVQRTDGDGMAAGAVEMPKAAAAVAMAAPQTLDEVQEQHLSDSFWNVR